MFDRHAVRETAVDTPWRRLSDAASWVDLDQEARDRIDPDLRCLLDDDPTADGPLDRERTDGRDEPRYRDRVEKMHEYWSRRHLDYGSCIVNICQR